MRELLFTYFRTLLPKCSHPLRLVDFTLDGVLECASLPNLTAITSVRTLISQMLFQVRTRLGLPFLDTKVLFLK